MLLPVIGRRSTKSRFPILPPPNSHWSSLWQRRVTTRTGKPYFGPVRPISICTLSNLGKWRFATRQVAIAGCHPWAGAVLWRHRSLDRPPGDGESHCAGATRVLRVPNSHLRTLLNRVPSLGEKLIAALTRRRELLSKMGTLGLRIVGPRHCRDTNTFASFSTRTSSLLLGSTRKPRRARTG